MTEVAGLLRVARLVTLIGPGGVGRTRLSVDVAGLADVAPDDVCFVELAPLRDAAAVPQALLRALGRRENGLGLGGRSTDTGRPADRGALRPDAPARPRQLRARGRGDRGARRAASGGTYGQDG
ncbi:hypothetical protein ACIGEZ_17695 [Streptomyces sp. NPDC085481]|uniref:hypothetical protein n=1 Tax=Streptomyces sp. NPDC085481 TaxID=3365727 RepID=UPI0037D6BA45